MGKGDDNPTKAGGWYKQTTQGNGDPYRSVFQKEREVADTLMFTQSESYQTSDLQSCKLFSRCRTLQQIRVPDVEFSCNKNLKTVKVAIELDSGKKLGEF